MGFLLAFGMVALFTCRCALIHNTQPDQPTMWTSDEKESFKTPLSPDELTKKTLELVWRKTNAELTPYDSWLKSRNDRSVPLRIGTGSEALRNAEHYLCARMMVSHWDGKVARAIAGAVVAMAAVGWTVGKTFDSYSVPTSAEFQSAVDGIFAGYQLPYHVSETAAAQTTGYYAHMTLINSVIIVGASIAFLLFVAAMVCRFQACRFKRSECNWHEGTRPS